MRFTRFTILVALFSSLGPRLSAQVRAVSLEDAIKLADRSSETVEVARAAVRRANGQQMQARSAFLPQLQGSISYSRALASQFEGLSFGSDSGSGGGGGGSGGGEATDFQSVGFGAENSWTLGLQFSQSVFTGGRASGQRIAANASRRAADVELTAQRAQLILDVTQTYYGAVLAARLSDIADASLGWNEDVLRQTTKAREVGSSSEFDLLRAQVARDNYVPVVLQRRSDRQIALLRLKQLLEIPLDDSVQLTTDIDVPPAATLASATGLAVAATPDTNSDARASVREAAENVRAQQGLKRAARAERFPTVAITSGYQRLFFPKTTFPQFDNFRENWNVGASIGVNLFTGGRIRGGEFVADANLRDAQARLKQAREFAALDSRIALSQLQQAEATWRASQGTAEQARKAYSIDEIRYREGISTQTDLTQSRLLVEQAMVNRAVAARDLAVARMRLMLLKDLPLAGGNQQSATGSASTPQAPPPTPSRSTTGTSAGPSSGSNQE